MVVARATSRPTLRENTQKHAPAPRHLPISQLPRPGRAETATNGAIGPPGGANHHWAVAPMWLVVAPRRLAGGANVCGGREW